MTGSSIVTKELPASYPVHRNGALLHLQIDLAFGPPSFLPIALLCDFLALFMVPLRHIPAAPPSPRGRPHHGFVNRAAGDAAGGECRVQDPQRRK